MAQHFKNFPHVLQVLPALNAGGVERVTIDVATFLKSHGLTTVASRGGNLIQELEAQKIPHWSLPLASKNPAQILSNSFQLARNIRAFNIDLIHVRSRAPAWSCLLASKLTGVPLVSTYHGLYGSHNSVKKFYNSAMIRGQGIIAISRYMEKHLKNIHPEVGEKIHLIYEGIDFNKFGFKKNDPSIVKEILIQWHIPPAYKILMLPGRYSPQKGHKIAIRALEHIKNAILICVGKVESDAKREKDLQLLAQECNVADRVRFVAAQSNMAPLYALADLILAPSCKPEAFGRIPIEAMAMKKLVISTNHGATPEQFISHLTDFLITPNDVLDLRRAIHQALALDHHTREHLIELAYQHVHEKFSLDRMMKETMAFYKQIAAGDKV